VQFKINNLRTVCLERCRVPVFKIYITNTDSRLPLKGTEAGGDNQKLFILQILIMLYKETNLNPKPLHHFLIVPSSTIVVAEKSVEQTSYVEPSLGGF